MTKAPLPANELARLADLQSYNILDTPEEKAFDEIVGVASAVLDIPVALVSLIDKERQWTKASVGMEPGEMPRDLAFCSYAILESGVMVVEDALEDERFRDNPLVVEEPHLRFYAGAPLITEAGHRLGTLALVDMQPHPFQAEKVRVLELLANRVMSELKLRRANMRLRQSRDNINRLFALLSDGVVVINQDGRMTFIDDKAKEAFSIETASAIGVDWQQALGLDPVEAMTLQTLLKDADNKPVQVELKQGQKIVQIHKAHIPESPRETALILSDVTELSQMRSILTADTSRHGLVGRAPAILKVFDQVERVASLDIPVLVSGETGTGKDLAANAIHSNSPRAEGPFVAINCGALTESLLSSQLFGHKRGAFTGAIEDQRGLFEAGSGGTVFLDEIGDMPMGLQVSLLRVLDNKEVVRLGETRPRKVDFRLVSASNRELKKLVAEGRFREDLYYRIRGMNIDMPSLRERREDIPLLLEHFSRIDALIRKTEPPQFSGNATAALMHHPWPGNVRELRSAISFAVLQSSGDIVRLADLPPEIGAANPKEVAATAPTTGDPGDAIRQSLEAAGGNRSKAAKLLGISRATLYRRMRELGI